jgi:hypothetical protein
MIGPFDMETAPEQTRFFAVQIRHEQSCCQRLSGREKSRRFWWRFEKPLLQSPALKRTLLFADIAKSGSG